MCGWRMSFGSSVELQRLALLHHLLTAFSEATVSHHVHSPPVFVPVCTIHDDLHVILFSVGKQTAVFERGPLYERINPHTYPASFHRLFLVYTLRV